MALFKRKSRTKKVFRTKDRKGSTKKKFSIALSRKETTNIN